MTGIQFWELVNKEKKTLDKTFLSEDLEYCIFAKKKDIERKFENFNEFCENFEQISQILTKIFVEMNANFRFHSHFCWLNEIFTKEIERKFGNSISRANTFRD